MSFDQELRRVIESMADRLRHEAAGHFQSAMPAFQSAIDEERVKAAASAREDAERAARDAEARFEAGLAEERAKTQAAEDRAAEASRRLTEIEANARIADVQVEETESSLSSITGRLATAEAALERTTAALEGERGRIAGLEVARTAAEAQLHSVLDEAEKQIEGRETAVRLADAIRAIDAASSLSALLDALAAAARRDSAAAAVLLVRGTQLRSWRLLGFGDALDQADAFDMPLSDAGIVVKAIEERRPVMSGRELRVGRPSEADDVPGFAELLPGRIMAALPVSVGGLVSAVVYADRADGSPSERDAWLATLDVLTRHAGLALEAMTVLRSTGAKAGQRAVSPAPQPVSVEEMPIDQAATARDREGGPDDDNGSGNASDDDNAENDDEEVVAARRYARLLLSEIRMYHESEVLLGRHERDLVGRLGGEIARARSLYEQRVPEHVQRVADHFHTELVITLADGDASLLGQSRELST